MVSFGGTCRIGEASNPGPHRGKRGGHRGGSDQLHFCTVNGSTWSALRGWMDGHSEARKQQGHREDVVLLGQEHRLLADRAVTSSRGMRRWGWQVGLSPAARTDAAGPNATSAGTLIAAGTHVGLQYIAGATSWDFSPKGSEGRVSAAWLDAGGGIIVVSVYLWHTEQWSARNHAIMEAVFQLAKSMACPWILAGDFNMSPECMLASEWPELLAGQVHAVREPRGTCRTSGGPRTYDFFVVDHRISNSVGRTWVDFDADTYPHWPVHMTLNFEYKRYTQLIMRKPKTIDLDLPIGCPPKPLVWPEVPDSLDSEAQSTHVWSMLASCAEEEALAARDIVGDAKKAYLGRDQAPRFVMVPVFRRALGISRSPR